ncbi:LysR family transcriptional regulator [Falsihalocynthiibacter arcticus]|uniref:LysR family transcriptional regulator n=1 Tax=Falsihalocynthiibacter arcticus TaxID=1579316 RepID=A0A126V2V8_9RHOB|nr:LysR family transcriptional regulator [Falsihalocynthiibacter arcticus]AML52658.1 LysR family transcriptional regulator [Falsihalocynthiibacter arcticus]
MTHLPLNALKTFEAVARLGSFQKAADELCVTQSAVSHQVRNLEDWLGVALFERTGRRPILTPQSEDLARAVILSFGDIAAACKRLRAPEGTKPLVIAAIPSIATSWLIPRLSAFRTAHPDIDIQVVYALHGQGIDFDEVDLAFTFGPTPTLATNLKSIPFLSGESAPVCSKWVFQSLGRTHPTLDDILGIGLLHDTDTNGWSQWFKAAGGQTPHALKGPIFEDINMLRTAAFSGQGAALCPLALIHEDLAAGRLSKLSDVTILDDFFYYLIMKKIPDLNKVPALNAFVNWTLNARSTEQISQKA